MTAITNQTIAERGSYSVGVAVQDVSTSDVTGEYVDMQGFDRVAAHVVTDELAENDVVTVQLKQATSDAGAGAKDLGEAVSFTAAGAEAAALIAEAKVSDLDIAGGFRYVAAEVGGTPVTGTTNAGAIMHRADGSYRP